MKYKDVVGESSPSMSGKMRNSTDLPAASPVLFLLLVLLSLLSAAAPKARKMELGRSLLPCRTGNFKKRSNCFVLLCKRLPAMRSCGRCKVRRMRVKGIQKKRWLHFAVHSRFLQIISRRWKARYKSSTKPECGRDSAFTACAALTTCRCHQSRHACGAGVSAGKLCGCGRSF